MEEIDRVFLKYSSDKLTQLASRIATCLDKLDGDSIWSRNSENENAVGNLVLHLCGNIRQWIGFGVGGQPDIRVRDREFQARSGLTAADLKGRLEVTIAEATAVLGKVSASDLASFTRIQNYDITKLEAIYHAVEHFSGHTGQIIFATKLATGSDLGFYKHLKAQPAVHSEPTP